MYSHIELLFMDKLHKSELRRPIDFNIFFDGLVEVFSTISFGLADVY